MPSIDYAFNVRQTLLVEPHSPTWDKFLDKRRAERPLTRRQAQAVADLQQGFKPLAEQAVAALYRLHRTAGGRRGARCNQGGSAGAKKFGQRRALALCRRRGDRDPPRHEPDVLRPARSRNPGSGQGQAHAGTMGQPRRCAAFRCALARHQPARPAHGDLLQGRLQHRARALLCRRGSKRIWGADGRSFTGLYYQRGTVPRYPSSLYTLADNSYPFLLSLDDYFDFYWRTRWRAEAGYRLAQHSILTLAFNRGGIAACARRQTSTSAACSPTAVMSISTSAPTGI